MAAAPVGEGSGRQLAAWSRKPLARAGCDSCSTEGEGEAAGGDDEGGEGGGHDGEVDVRPSCGSAPPDHPRPGRRRRRSVGLGHRRHGDGPARTPGPPRAASRRAGHAADGDAVERPHQRTVAPVVTARRSAGSTVARVSAVGVVLGVSRPPATPPGCRRRRNRGASVRVMPPLIVSARVGGHRQPEHAGAGHGRRARPPQVQRPGRTPAPAS